MNEKDDADSWEWLLSTGADLALLQEAKRPAVNVEAVEADPGGQMLSELDTDQWIIDGYIRPSGRAAVVKLSDRVSVKWHKWHSFATREAGRFRVSRPGTIAAAQISPSTKNAFDPFVVVSMYAVWENYHGSTKGNKCFADASAHRLISDLSVFLYPSTRHRVIAAGDLNILHGYGESGSDYWAARYSSVFSRMDALGLSFVGPQYPNGRRAYSRSDEDELPNESQNVPTYCDGGCAKRQLDFVFASKSMADSVRVCALNEPDQWGPSDHCRIEINVASPVS